MPGIEAIELESRSHARPRPTGRSRLMYLLDTNVVSELRKIRRQGGYGVADWADSVDSIDLFCR